jgi:hypothetical protein
MNKLLLGAILLFSTLGFSQVNVNNIDISKETETFDVWSFVKPFSGKESYFIDYGQDSFKPHYYDHKSQAIFDKDGVKFEKGQWIKLVNYLKTQGFEEATSRTQEIGDVKGRITNFKRVKG